jgi:SET domain-containing protein
MALTQSDAIEVKRVRGKGRGVFARRPIEAGEVIETCPVLVLPAGAVEDVPAGIGGYVFEWGRGQLALALGYGSLYNHSYRPNACYVDLAGRTKEFTAIRDIAAGEEITVNYNGEPGDETPVGFEVVEGPNSSAMNGLVDGSGDRR